MRRGASPIVYNQDEQVDNYSGNDDLGVVPYDNAVNVPPTLSQEHLEFLDGIEEVPEELLKPLWGLFTRHNALTNISTPWEMERVRTQVRAVTRTMMWEGTINLKQMVMIQRYVDLQLMKSHRHGERKLLAPWLQQITKIEEYVDKPPQRPAGGFFARGAGFLFGRH